MPGLPSATTSTTATSTTVSSSTSDRKVHGFQPPGGVSVEATGINGKGDVVGWMTTSGGTIKSFLLKGGVFTILAYPHATATQALAVNWQDQIVGSFVDAAGQTHGFILTDPLNQPNWVQVDDPKASGPTVITGIENTTIWSDTTRTTGPYRDGSSRRRKSSASSKPSLRRPSAQRTAAGCRPAAGSVNGNLLPFEPLKRTARF